MARFLQVINEYVKKQEVYVSYSELYDENPELLDGETMFFYYEDEKVDFVISKGTQNFRDLIPVIAGAINIDKTELEYDTVPGGVIVGSYTTEMVAKHGKRPFVIVWFQNKNQPEAICQLDDQEDPTAFTIDLGCEPITKTYVKFI